MCIRVHVALHSMVNSQWQACTSLYKQRSVILDTHQRQSFEVRPHAFCSVACHVEQVENQQG